MVWFRATFNWGSMNKIFFILLGSTLLSVNAYASDCAGAIACGVTGIDQVVTSCLSSFECTGANRDKLILTASDLARRSIDQKKCTRFRFREECNLCYGAVKAQLTIKTTSSPLKRLAGQASRLVEVERKVQCKLLPSVRDNGCGCL